MKKNLPYFLLTFCFCSLFIVTQKLDTKTFSFIFFNVEQSEIYQNDKTTIQFIIFVYILSLSLVILSFLEITKKNFPQIIVRIGINIVTICIIYTINYLLSLVFKTEGFNIYNDWRKNMGLAFASLTMILNFMLVLIVNFFIFIFTKKLKTS